VVSRGQSSPIHGELFAEPFVLGSVGELPGLASGSDRRVQQTTAATTAAAVSTSSASVFRGRA
jgi:hypothetical protein